MTPRARWMRRARLTPVALGAALGTWVTPLTTTAVAAQDREYAPQEARWLDSGVGEDVMFAAANAVLSGVVAGLFRKFSDDGSFAEGFRTGATGGVVSYAGKRVAAQRFDGAGLVGRQVAAVGGSLASNAGSGRGPFDRLIFPLGLGRLYWDRVASTVVVRPDLVTVYYTAVGAMSSGVRFDLPRSLSAGAPVFVTHSGTTTLDDNAAGRTFGGVVVVDVNADIPYLDIEAHERVHVVQYDQHVALWSEAAERGLVSLFGEPASNWLGRVDLGIAFVPLAPFRTFMGRGVNPLEIEADYLTVR